MAAHPLCTGTGGLSRCGKFGSHNRWKPDLGSLFPKYFSFISYYTIKHAPLVRKQNMRANLESQSWCFWHYFPNTGANSSFIKNAQWLCFFIFWRTAHYLTEYRGNQNSVKWDDSVSSDIKGQCVWLISVRWQYCLKKCSQKTGNLKAVKS